MTWNPAAQVEDIASKKLKSRLGLKKELKTLPSYLAEGEQVLNLSSGLYDGANGLVVLTDRRVFFLSAGISNSRFEDFGYDKITSVQTSSSMMFGEITIHASGNKAEMKNMMKDRVKEIGEYVRNQINAPKPPPETPATAPVAAPPSDDPADQIRKLAALRDEGILTEEEFAAKKRQILGL
jgi:hypothetical protein